MIKNSWTGQYAKNYKEIEKGLKFVTLSKSWTFKAFYNKQKIAKFRLKGTTYSGHPTATTLGNTIRVLTYLSWYIYKIDPTFDIFGN